MGKNWHSITINSSSTGNSVFNGFFSVDNVTNYIDEFYNYSNPTVNIIAHTPNDYGADFLFVDNDFTYNGAAITSIPSLDSAYNAQEWLLWKDSTSNTFGISYTDELSYKVSSRTWLDLASHPYTFVFASIPAPSCFNHDTKILCLTEQLEEKYLPIQSLKKGDIVKTYLHGYRRIEHIGKGSMTNNPNSFDRCMYKMVKTEENGLTEDLIITGWHAILVDKLSNQELEVQKNIEFQEKIDDKYLLLSSSCDRFVTIKDANLYVYYHLSLENDGDHDKRFGIWANGILTETTSKNFFMEHKYEDI